MKRIAIVASLITVSMWLAGCTGSASLSWGPKGQQYEQTAKPGAHAWELADHR